MNQIVELWKRKSDPQGRINITVFFVNLFLLLCHIFLMVVYVMVGHKIMIIVNTVSLLIYFASMFLCYKNIERYMGVAFLEIWVHLIFAILSFGWRPCFQNWCFGMIVAYFLPSFSSTKMKINKKSFFFTFIIIFTYFFLATFPPLVNIDIFMELDLVTISILFIANNLFTFFTIMMFAHFYTSKSNRKEIELSRKADYDELTGLYNRYALNELSKRYITQAEKNDQPFNVAIMDIDFFKKINDQYGHTSGDLVLKKFAIILKSSTMGKMTAGRWGGEEFIVMGSSDIPYKKFTDTLENLRRRVSKTIFKGENNENIGITISIGAASIKDPTDINDAVQVADERLYKAKETGRNKLIKK